MNALQRNEVTLETDLAIKPQEENEDYDRS